MKKKSVALLLSLTMVAGLLPSAAFASTEQLSSAKTETEETAECVPNEVLVLYEAGEVSVTESGGQASVKTGKSFGTVMTGIESKKSAQREAAEDLNNSLYDQAAILKESLGRDFVIEDTVIFGDAAEAGVTLQEEGAAEQEALVISVVRSDSLSAEEMAARLAENPAVRAAEPNYIYKPLAAAGSGEYMDYTWHLEDSGDTDTSIHVTDMWNALGDASGDEVVVAVLDSGVDYTHEELADHMWVNDTDDSNLKGVHGYDFLDRDGDPMDEDGHGTHCSGIIAADGQNAAGVAGVASPANVKIMALRFLGSMGGTEADAIGAYYYLARAAEAGVNVKLVSNSWGGPGGCDVFNAVVEDLGKNHGVLSVFAAGNDGVNNDYTESSPANLTSDYGVTVAATNEKGELAGYSQYGRKTVDIAAPGNILSSVSYYNYAPWLYKADKVAELSDYYGEFSADQEITKDENGLDTITPVLGTDIDGTAIAGVKEFGPSRMISQTDLGGTGEGTMSLSLSDEKCANRSTSPACLKWHITGASMGETYFLFFPFELNPASNLYNTCFAMPWQVATDATQEIGEMWCGEIGRREDGTYEMINGGGFYARHDYKDVWGATMIEGLSDSNSEMGYKYEEVGIGFMYVAYGEGDVDVYLDSLGIAKPTDDASVFGKYDLYSGTSMATPVVTGSLALLAAKYPEATPLELKAMLFATADDSLEGYVGTGGKVDFSRIDYEADPAAAFAPAVTGSSVNTSKRLVTLKGQHFGTEKGSIVYELPVRAPGETFTVAPEDITTWTDTKIVFKDNTEGKGLIDSDGRVCVTTATGKTGEYNTWFVRGEKGFTFYAKGQSLNGEDDDFLEFSKGLNDLEYDKAYDSDEDYDYDYDDEMSGASGVLTPITDGTRFLAVDESGEIVEIKKGQPQEEFDFDIVMNEGDVAAEEPVEEEFYAETKESYSTVVGTDEDMAAWKANDWEKMNRSVTPLTNAVWMKGVVYEWLRVSLGDRDIFVLAGYNPVTDKWKSYYTTYGVKTSEIPIPMRPSGECYADMRMAAAGGMLYWTSGMYLDWSDWFDIKIDLNRTMYSMKPSDPTTLQKYDDVFPEGLLGGKFVTYKNQIYYLLGYDLDANRNMTVYSLNKKDGTWSEAGTLPVIVESIASMSDEEDVAVGVCDKGIVISGLAFDGYGDTIVVDPTNPGTVLSSGRSIFGETPTSVVRGLTVGNKLYIYYDVYENEGETKFSRIETLNLSVMDCASAYSTIKKTAGKGSTISGVDSYVKGETASLTVKAKSGYYIRSVTVDGKAVAKAAGVTVSANTKSKVVFKLKTSKDTHVIKSIMGKYSTKVTFLKKVSKLAAGKSVTLKAAANGTNKRVTWKVSNTKYASITAAGKLTAKKAGKGKTVTVTATAKDGSKKKASIKVKIS